MNPSGGNVGGRPQVRADGLIVERVGQEFVIYDATSQMAHSLPADAALVWEQCDGRKSEAEIASKLQLPAQVVGQAVDEFRASGLLADEGGYTRRQAGKRFAAVGGAALAAPLLYSAAVPGAALAQTGGCPTSFGVTCDTDNNAFGTDAMSILITAELMLSGTIPSHYVINATNIRVCANNGSSCSASTASCNPACTVPAPNSTITGDSSTTAPGNYCFNGQFHVNVPSSASNVFLFGLALPPAAALCFFQPTVSQYNIFMTLSGPVGMTVQLRAASFAFSNPVLAYSSSNCVLPPSESPPYPTTCPTNPALQPVDYQFIPSDTSNSVPIIPANPCLHKVTGGSNGSGRNGSSCTFTYTHL